MPDRSDRGKLGIWPYDTRLHPIAPPTTGIFDEPTASVCINVRWLGHIDGVLERLLWEDAWAGTDEVKQFAIAQITALMAAMAERFPCGNRLLDDCGEMAPHHPAIEWLPTNPFVNPDEIPSGYLAAPFSIVNLEIEGWLGALADLLGIDLAYLAGLQNGDVITTIISIPNNPIGVLTDGFPRFIVHVVGQGTVNLDLVNLPLGGLCAIGKDTYIDIPGLIGGTIGGGVTLVDLNRDFVSIPPETATIIGQEITFDTDGPHFIEVAFLPIVDDSVTLLRYGGGLRGITLCGFEPVNGNNVIRQNPDDCKILEQSSDGITWTPVADFTDCMESMDCDEVVDCVTHSEDFDDFLGDYLRDHPDGSTYPKDQPIPDDVRITITQGDSCDHDMLWAQCVGVVSTAHIMIGQFFTAWGAFSNEGDIVRGIVANTPLLGPLAYSLGIVGVKDYASLLVSSIAALYAAAADDDYREQLACALFCAGKEACYVTIDNASSILNERIGGLISLISTTDIMESLVTLDLSGMNVADVYMAAFFNLLHQGNLVWPEQWGIDSFLASVAAYNVPSNDWETVCEDCPEETEGTPHFTLVDVFNNMTGGSWYGSAAPVAVFVGNVGDPADGIDIFDIPITRDVADNYQVWMEVSPQCHVISHETDLVGFTYYNPSDPWTNKDITLFSGRYVFVAYKVGSGPEGTIRITIGPV